VGYWLTNILGLILLHKGAQDVMARERESYTRRHFIRDLVVSLAYTLLILLLVWLGILRPLQNYFPEK
jgi:hypothetical protein